MNTTTQEQLSTKVVTGLVRLSYAHLWVPTAIEEGGKKKYSASLLIPKEDKVTINRIKKAIEAAKEQGKTSKFGGKIPANLKLPLRDGDVDRPDDEGYAGHYFINASSVTQPGIIDKAKNQILNQDEVYSGCYAMVSITFYPFNTQGNKGIACGLNHVMKVKDGEPMGGHSSAESDFADVDISEFDEDDL